jgi:hypothetical protein
VDSSVETLALLQPMLTALSFGEPSDLSTLLELHVYIQLLSRFPFIGHGNIANNLESSCILSVGFTENYGNYFCMLVLGRILSYGSRHTGQECNCNTSCLLRKLYLFETFLAKLLVIHTTHFGMIARFMNNKMERMWKGIVASDLRY